MPPRTPPITAPALVDPFAIWPRPREQFALWLAHEGYAPDTVRRYTRLVAKAQRERAVQPYPGTLAWTLYETWSAMETSEDSVRGVYDSVSDALGMEGADRRAFVSAYTKLAQGEGTNDERWQRLTPDEHELIKRRLGYVNEARTRVGLPALTVPVRRVAYDEAVGLVAGAFLTVLKPVDALLVQWADLRLYPGVSSNYHGLRAHEEVKLPRVALWVLAQRLEKGDAIALDVLKSPASSNENVLRFASRPGEPLGGRLLTIRDVVEQGEHPIPQVSTLPKMPFAIEERFLSATNRSVKRKASTDAE